MARGRVCGLEHTRVEEEAPARGVRAWPRHTSGPLPPRGIAPFGVVAGGVDCFIGGRCGPGAAALQEHTEHPLASGDILLKKPPLVLKSVKQLGGFFE